MSRYNNNSTLLSQCLGLVMGVSLVGTVIMGLAALIMQSLGQTRAQILLTLVCLLLGSLLMQVQLRARRQSKGGTSILLSLGVAVIVVSQVSFLILVWTDWKTDPYIWRMWWLSMVPSVFLTHVILLHAAASRRGGLAEAITGFFAVWAGLMILCLGFRDNMLAGISQTYLWVGAVPAAGTVLGTIYVLVCRFIWTQRPGAGAKRITMAGLVTTTLVVAVTAFYVGRATAPGTAEPDQQPLRIVNAAGGDVDKQLRADRYRIQSRVAEYLGDTRIVNRPPFITEQQISQIEPRLRPGDILLERRNWYLSNPFLPGFWPHSVLYIGRLSDLKRLGVTAQPAFRRNSVAYFTAAADGRGNAVIEAVSESVILNSLTHSCHADYLAVLRPRLSEPQVAAAITRAFEDLGKPYDFNFDFDETDKLVCTELVRLAYLDTLNFPTVRIMGRNTLPANELARQYVAAAERPDRQLDFVLFLDGIAAQGKAVEADEAAFRQSTTRPNELVERRGGGAGGPTTGTGH